MLQNVLKSKFGYDNFKNDTQKQAIIAIHKGKQDVFVCMPTGSGKSLCFQLPAIMKEHKVVIVFSPLLALMKNQIDFLVSKKINACSLNSTTSSKERNIIMEDLMSNSPKIKLLYVTPEMGAQQHFQETITKLNKKKALSYFVIDEAHCLSEWGHDFRPTYRQLGVFKKLCSKIPMIALTATAAKQVKDDILESLHMKDALIFSQPVFRSNLYYDVWFLETLEKPFVHLKNFILDSLGPSDNSIPMHKRNCGIIYCRKKETTEIVAHKLTLAGITTLAYHGSLKAQERNEVQNKWTTGEVPVITATCSFGMGVDKASVRFVIHWTVPKNIAAYYQESGRAGRDGNPAFCRVYFSNEEYGPISFLIKEEITHKNSELAKVKWQDFEKSVAYCLEAKCRHAVFSKYFGDSPPPCKNRCDICKNKEEVRARISQFEMCTAKKCRSNIGSVMQMNYDDGEIDGFDEPEESREKIIAIEKRERKELIMKQFALRRNLSKEEKMKRQNIKYAKVAHVRAADSTDKKIKGLTVQVREHFYNELKVALFENYQHSSKDNKQLQEKDIHDMANNIEYKIFSSTKVPNKYKLDMSKLISSIRKCTNNNTIYEGIRDYKETEYLMNDTKQLLNNSNNIDILNSEQASDVVKIEFNENTSFSNECSKPNFPSTFKTALEVLNEEKLQAFTSEKSNKIQSKKLCVQNIKRNEIKNETSIDFNNTQKNARGNETSLMQMSNDFVCARKIYDSSIFKLNTSSSKSKSNTSSSKSKVCRSKTDKGVKKTGKTVYEQILASARSVSKKTADEEDIFVETELKIDNVIECVKNKDEIKNRNKNKRDFEFIEHHKDDIKPAKKRRIVHNECNDEINNYALNQNIDKKNLEDKIETGVVTIEDVHTDTNTNINTINDEDLSMMKRDKTKKHLEREVNTELKKRKEKTADSFHLKQHGKNKSNNKLKVPADKVMQFKTAEILKSYLMKYYPSERLPDRATFSKTCREMHYNMLRKKIFDKEGIHNFVTSFMNQS